MECQEWECNMAKKQKKDKKIKILVHADSPRAATGFGTVTKGIFDYLARTGKYEIEIFGVNDIGFVDPDPEKTPYKILPAMLPGAMQQDFYGRNRFIDVVRGGDKFLKPPWDIIFTLNDPFIFEQPILTPEIGMIEAVKDLNNIYREKTEPHMWFKTVSYWPVDSSIKENWVEHAIGISDYSVAYTDYGKKEIEKANQKLPKPMRINLDVIYHGSSLKNYYPITDKEKRDFKATFFQKAKIDLDNTFIVGIVARNQVRKDIPRAMKVFKEFQRRRPDSFLYIHAKEQDAWGSLAEYARQFNLEIGKDWIYPGNFDAAMGYPVEILNKIYNIMDVHILTTKGEGWGLPITEAMATKTLNICPNITSIPEIFNTVGNDYEDLNTLEGADIRGIPVKSGSTSSEWITDGPSDFERVRPLTNVDDMVKKLVWAYDNPDKTKAIVDRAHEWVQILDWAKIAEEWDVFFQRVYNDLEQERKHGKNKKQKENKSKDTKGVS